MVFEYVENSITLDEYLENNTLNENEILYVT